MEIERSSPATKRQKKLKERYRVTRACDSCKKKKARCTGTAPCLLCVRQGTRCDYNASYSRGRLPVIRQISTLESLGTDIENVETLLEDDFRQTPIQNGDRQVNSSRNSPEPPQTDLEGHYVGPSSGVSFLLRAQKRLHESVTLSSNTSIFTFGDSPLPKYDPSFLILPTREEAEKLVAHYFDFGFPTHRFLHRPTIDKWLIEFYDKLRHSGLSPGDLEKRALLLMIMASAMQYLKNPGTGLHDSAVFFGASEHYLAEETGAIRLTSVQARLAQCFYLLTRSRINHCWSLFGTMVRLAFALGLHRRRRRETTSGLDVIELECRKRTFWCAYSLDNYLSAALGRPRSFHDEDIDQELPACANDVDITATHIIPNTSKVQTTMLAPVFHAKLSKILNGVLRELYGLRRSSTQAQVAIAEKYDKQIAEWREGITFFLDATDRNLLITLYQRQHTVLSLASAHAEILLNRPFLLSNFANLARGQADLGNLKESLETKIQKCVKAAATIVRIICELAEGDRMFHAFWFTLYYGFSAVVVLYVYIIQHSNSPQSVWKDYLEAAEKCQGALESCATDGSLAQRYGVVLDELKAEALKQLARGQQIRNMPQAQPQQSDSTGSKYDRRENSSMVASNVGGTGESTEEHEFAVPQNFDPSLIQSEGFGLPAPEQDFLQETSPSSFIAEMTGWGEFDSLVLGGMGDIEVLLPQGVAVSGFDQGGMMNAWDELAG